ncbi:tetratricopeptide repeat protein [Aestuariibacter salexigens]|uniref:tetratricopeptide repeat protein n=1 Tax=Aestuariibacter salexigens TaxID=226010 RepID=UPI00041CD2CD|nr:tetratricopeptide repeat protein [Aestuariibacter salexigens]
MSVVNKMLNDLEQRKADEQPVNADYQPPVRRSLRVWVWALLAAVIIAALLAMYWPLQTQPPTATADKASSTEVNAVPLKPKAMQKQVTAAADDKTEKQATVTVTQERPVDVAADDVETDEPVANVKPEQEDQQKNTSSQPIQSEEESEGLMQVKRQPQAPDAAVSLRQQAEKALAENNKPAAVAALESLLKREPENLVLRKRLASLHFALNNSSRTEQLLRDGLEQQPQAADIRLMLARLHANQGESETALQVLLAQQVSAELYPDYINLRAGLAERLGQDEQAQKDFTLLLQTDKQQARWWLGLAVSLERQQRFAEAYESYVRAKQVNRQHAQLDVSVLNFIDQRLSELENAS